MHKIYFEKRCIVICSPSDDMLSDPNCVEFRPGTELSLGPLVRMFQQTSSISKIYIPAAEEDAAYRRLCSEFREVDAAGGLVRNRRGDYLLIRRMGLWDLPKGHREAGEDVDVTALREVREETGVQELELQGLICVTDHCYFRDGVWHLKHTWWYDMLYTEPVELVPQREEDISKAAWVAKSSLPPFLKNSFPSIVEVFHEGRIL